MAIGGGVVVAINEQVSLEVFERFVAAWRERLPDVKSIIVNDARIIEREEITLFSFTGDVSPTMVAEFQLWWQEVNRG